MQCRIIEQEFGDWLIDKPPRFLRNAALNSIRSFAIRECAEKKSSNIKICM